jgi:glyoxylase-like metal-dependent hydrolase (beta-lactamase superfamily II)
MILRCLPVGPLDANCYILAAASPGPAVVIDPGGDEDRIAAALRELRLTPEALVLTHGHLDHVGAAAPMKKSFNAPLLVHARDASILDGSAASFYLPGLRVKPLRPDRLIADGEIVEAGGRRLRVLHTPGHSPGSVCLYCPDVSPGLVFSGDTLFAGGVGRTDFPGGSYESLMGSIRDRLLSLPDDTVVYPGHGPSSTIGKERRGNPFLQ